MQNPEKLKEMMEIYKQLNKKYAGVDDVAKLVVKVGEMIKDHKDSIDKKLSDHVTIIENDLSNILQELQADVRQKLETSKNLVENTSSKNEQKLQELTRNINNSINEIKNLIPRQIDITPVLRRIEEVENKIPEIPDVVLESPQETRNKLESLKGNDRLDKTSVRGIEELEKEIKDIKTSYSSLASRVIGGLQGLFTYIDGTKKGILKSINFVGGTGVTITHSKVNGLDTVTFEADGGGGGSSNISLSIVPSGDVDGVNLVFTFPAEATKLAVYADGARAIPTADYSFVASSGSTTITFVYGRQPFSSILVDYTV